LKRFAGFVPFFPLRAKTLVYTVIIAGTYFTPEKLEKTLFMIIPYIYL
jgi:hypothetical protein